MIGLAEKAKRMFFIGTSSSSKFHFLTISPNKFWAVWICQMGMSVHFLTFFFGANALRIIPTSGIMGYKLLVWANIGNTAFNELQKWGSLKPGEPDHTEGEYRFLGLCAGIVELFVCYKNYSESALLADEPKILDWVFYSWCAFIFSQFCIYLHIRFINRPKYMADKPEPLLAKQKNN